MDYSGLSGPAATEGICVMDHPSNPNHPTRWHVRADGWIGASFNRESSHEVARDRPLALRYRLLVHSGAAGPESLNQEWDRFARTPPYAIATGASGGLAMLVRGGAAT
jgi:hypothetical protein